jgi:hypothetical protein
LLTTGQPPKPTDSALHLISQYKYRQRIVAPRLGLDPVGKRIKLLPPVSLVALRIAFDACNL